MDYYDMLIEVADDCSATEAQVPQAWGAKTKAMVEYELLAKNPYIDWMVTMLAEKASAPVSH